MTDSHSNLSRWRRWLLKPAVLPLTRIFVLLVCLSLVAIDAWVIWQARSVQLREAQIETSNLASALARQASDMLKKADTVLLDLVERLQVDGTDPEQLQRLHGLMRQHVYGQAELHGLFAFDRDGNWLVSSYGTPPGGGNYADREYFTFHRNYPSDHGLHVGLPVRSRTTNEWVIPLSRRLQDAQGNFAGVVLASISINYLSKFYATFDIRSRGAINLTLNSGIVLLRSPYREASIGADLSKTQIFTELLPQSPVGTVMLRSVVDDVERMHSYRQVQNYPLLVVTALAKDDILADWRAETARQLLVVSLLAGLLGLFGFYLIRLIKQGQQSEAELLATRDALHVVNQRLEQQAMEDELTRLANRRCFIRALDEEFSRAARYQRPLALVLFDVDYFKQYNDVYGHSAGDECLRAVATTIRSAQQRPGDLAVRHGGEEFCLLLPETNTEGALQVAERVRAAVEALAIPHTGCPWQRLSLSAGVHVLAPQVGDSPEQLIKGADKALYAAKAAGRDCVLLFDASVERSVG